jgi:hypothetical protein
VLIERRWRNTVLDDDLCAITDVDGRCGQELRVERIELLGVLVGPEREPGGAADHLEGVLKGIYDVISREAVA